MVIGIFAGCSTAMTKDSPFAMYNEYESMQVSIGDKRADVEKQLGTDIKYDTVFEEENIERMEYWDNEDVSVDYDMATEHVVGMRFAAQGWSTYNGLKVGDSSDDVVKKYPEGTVHKTTKSNDLWVAYDREGEIIAFGDDAPFLVRFKITDGKVAMIIVMDNEAYPEV